VTPIEDDKLPTGFKVAFHELHGVNLTDRWYTATLPDGTKINFGDLDSAVHACIAHSRWGKPPSAVPKEDDSIEASWIDIGHPRADCVTCNKTVNDDGSKILWRCSVCGHLVCMQCTKTIGNLGREYHEKTLCSEKCWITAGRPSE
jgi:hypothetical protein